MDSRINALLLAFEKYGWNYSNEVDLKNEWWFEKVLELNSTWKSLNQKLYLTLLTDPAYIHEKKVWAIGVSSVLPTENNFAYTDILRVKEIHKTNLLDFVSTISRKVRE